ncbi:interleukin-2 receptor subunit beta-like [Pungitius pungitius]|uniref:interleukin-2 receptor subunit beta-like n=1 Tax=Pungitius pungitius TaxID=134920 RepID=UPI002E12EEA6
MERSKGGVLLGLLALLCTAEGDNCSGLSDDELTCVSDYSRFITCAWSSPSEADRPDNVCTILAERRLTRYKKYNSSCRMEPVDASTPRLKKCHLIFKNKNMFQSSHKLSIHLSCNATKTTLQRHFKPACHIKLDPPPKPSVVSTTVSWFPQATKHGRINLFKSQVQWKAEAQAWTDASVQVDERQDSWNISVELDPDQLLRGQRYEVRVRVMAVMVDSKSTWSDWSPVASWDSSVGRPQPTDLQVWLLSVISAAAALAVFLLFIHFKTDKTTWVYMVKRITGPPLPDPAKSFLQDVDFQSWLRPHLPSGSFTSFSRPRDAVSMEVTSAVDAVAPCGLEEALLEKLRGESSFSNPSYSQVCPPPPSPPPPPVSSLTAGALAPCAADTPYGVVGGRHHEAEIRLLLSKGCESVPVVSDYERAEEVLVERARLQSLDSGVCSGEEVSQESLEADSINAADGEEESGGGVDFRKLLAGGGSVPVCSGYERVPQLLSVREEELGGQEELKASSESTRLLLPRPPLPPFSSSPCFLPPALCGVGPAPRPLPLEQMVLMSSGSPLEPCGDGYM